MAELKYNFLTKKIIIDEYIERLVSNAVSCFSGIVVEAAGVDLFVSTRAAVSGTVALIDMKQL